MGLSLLEPLGSEGSGILKTGYGGKRRVPADVSHEFGSCARLNGTCPESMCDPRFSTEAYACMAREPVARATAVKSSTKDYENIYATPITLLASLSSVCSTLSFLSVYTTLSVYNIVASLRSRTSMKSAPPTALAFHRFLFSTLSPSPFPLSPFPSLKLYPGCIKRWLSWAHFIRTTINE